MAVSQPTLIAERASVLLAKIVTRAARLLCEEAPLGVTTRSARSAQVDLERVAAQLALRYPFEVLHPEEQAQFVAVFGRTPAIQQAEAAQAGLRQQWQQQWGDRWPEIEQRAHAQASATLAALLQSRGEQAGFG